MTGFQRCLHAGSPLRFHADYLDIIAQHLGQSRDAGCQTASADRDQNIIYQRQILDNLHGNRTLPGSDTQIVEGMDHCIPLFPCKLLSLLAGLIVNISIQDDLSSV